MSHAFTCRWFQLLVQWYGKKSEKMKCHEIIETYCLDKDYEAQYATVTPRRCKKTFLLVRKGGFSDAICLCI